MERQIRIENTKMWPSKGSNDSFEIDSKVPQRYYVTTIWHDKLHGQILNIRNNGVKVHSIITHSFPGTSFLLLHSYLKHFLIIFFWITDRDPTYWKYPQAKSCIIFWKHKPSHLIEAFNFSHWMSSKQLQSNFFGASICERGIER